jgi:hypothetical protein
MWRKRVGRAPPTWMVTAIDFAPPRRANSVPIMGDMTEGLPADLIEAIAREHLVKTPLEPADLRFFGARRGVDEFLVAIVDLWRCG